MGQRMHRHNVPAARRLRQRLTRSETLLWDELRDRRFANLKFRRQHPIGVFVLDFFCEERLLAIEIDGGVHNEPEQETRDRLRQEIIQDRGIRFFRCTAEDVERDIAAVMARLDTFISSLP
jgi:very-short-patch-repair endonuclease